MNKITPHKLRDLHATLPSGTEHYLGKAVRKSLNRYRNGYESKIFLDKNQALLVLSQRLGRGLRRFLQDDIQIALSVYQKDSTNKAVYH